MATVQCEIFSRLMLTDLVDPTSVPREGAPPDAAELSREFRKAFAHFSVFHAFRAHRTNTLSVRLTCIPNRGEPGEGKGAGMHVAQHFR